MCLVRHGCLLILIGLIVRVVLCRTTLLVLLALRVVLVNRSSSRLLLPVLVKLADTAGTGTRSNYRTGVLVIWLVIWLVK